MKAEQGNSVGKDPAGHIGTQRAITSALGNPLITDAAADADLARMIDRLRGEPGCNNGGKQ